MDNIIANGLCFHARISRANQQQSSTCCDAPYGVQTTSLFKSPEAPYIEATYPPFPGIL